MSHWISVQGQKRMALIVGHGEGPQPWSGAKN